MAEFVVKLQDLKERIINEFITVKNYSSNDSAVDQIDPNNLETLLFLVKCQIDTMMNNILWEKNDEFSKEIRDLESQKADALIKLQTLAASITCHVINLDKNVL